jgi:hypothetical protein
VEISKISNAYPAFFQPKSAIQTAILASVPPLPVCVNYILRCSPSRSYAAGPLRPKASGISTVDGCASRMTQNKKEAFMKRAAKIDSINIRRSHLGLTGIVYSYGYAYAVRYAPDAIVTEALIRKSWREQRPAFRPYNDSTDAFV